MSIVTDLLRRNLCIVSNRPDYMRSHDYVHEYGTVGSFSIRMGVVGREFFQTAPRNEDEGLIVLSLT
jgi:hypothetical protein